MQPRVFTCQHQTGGELMQVRRLRRPSHATIVAYVALFAAVGGTSYAAATIGSKDIKRSAVRSKHVKNRTLLKKDFKAGQLPAGARGPRGFPGSAKAYAIVDPAKVGKTPSGVPPNSKGVLSVVQPERFSSD